MSTTRLVSTAGDVRLATLLGRGGEGAVYEVDGLPQMVAKVYHKPAHAEKAAKLQAMAAMASPQLLSLTAWPTDVLRAANGAVYGLLMPKIDGYKDIHTLYGPKSRRIEFPNSDWRHLVRAAANTARAFAVLHDANCVVGDVNHGGIRVSPSATVRLIDCDSFQISVAGKYFLCEVGVENFTPPELQGKPFKGVIRTPNHDNFGLAVMVFNLLMMGRHPFAGRYLGREEMPVERAIAEYRYAYGRDSAGNRMQPPPYSVRPAAVSADVAELWEKAFAREGSDPGARPTARQWITALTSIEGRFAPCKANPAHYYLAGTGDCPWCPIETASGTLLFAIPMIAGSVQNQRGRFDINAVWSRIAAVPSPGPVTEPAVPSVAVSTDAARDAALRKHLLIGARIAVVLGAGVLCWIFGDLWLLWLMGSWVAWATTGSLADKFADVNPFIQRQRQADSAFQDAVKRWMEEAGPERFMVKLRALEVAKKEWQGLAEIRQKLYGKLVKERERNERKRFLERFEIENAKIPGIGPAKRSMLESYNIETAADINRNAILNVPGFGPAMAKRLEDWRRSVEHRFVFNPNSAVDPRDVADLDGRIATQRTTLEKALLAGPAELTQLRGSIMAQRNVLQRHLQTLAQAFAQANADMKAVQQ